MEDQTLILPRLIIVRLLLVVTANTKTYALIASLICSVL